MVIPEESFQAYVVMGPAGGGAVDKKCHTGQAPVGWKSNTSLCADGMLAVTSEKSSASGAPTAVGSSLLSGARPQRNN
jgi:hypothetical protein